MRFLGIGDCCDLSALYLRLAQEGHEVKVHIANSLSRDTLAGLIVRVDHWRNELGWLRDAGDEGIALFENTAEQRGHLQDALRRDGYNVIGGSAAGDRLENDRAFAQGLLQRLDFTISPIHEFSDRHRAVAFLRRNPARCVLKFNGPDESFVGQLDDGRDVRAFVAGLPQTHDRFILMRHVEGVEMGVGAYFDGERFLHPACLDWEHKRFFPGDLGELTGEMGTVVTYRQSSRFFDLTLGRLAPHLRESGYCGYINLNTIVNEAGIWPLEFTSRFGYPGYAILGALQATPWGELFHAMVTRAGGSFETEPGFAVGIVLTTPPFPYARPAVEVPVGLPILFDESLTEADRRHLHYGEVGLKDGQLVTSGIYGWTMVVTGVEGTIGAAKDRANRLAERVIIPNVRYRRDIGARLIAGDLARVERLGLFAAGAENPAPERPAVPTATACSPAPGGGIPAPP